MKRLVLIGVALAALLGTTALGVEPPSSADAAADATDAATKRIDEILTRLQKRSDGLEDIRCDVKFVDDDRINLSKGVKRGRILFLIAEPNPQFLIHFDKNEMDGIVTKQEWYLFDGQWFYQAIERIKQVTKQEIAPPGEKIDLFDLETAPFPLPFGQKKETILRNFDVELVSAAPGDPPDTDHLACTPKQGSRLQRKYGRLDLYVHRSVHLPTRIVVTKNDGYEISTADFPDLSHSSLNTGLRAKDLGRPAAWKKYKEVVEELVPADEPSP